MPAQVTLQFVDNLLFGFTVGQVILYSFLLSLPVAVVLKSWKIFGILTLVFGLLLVATPGSLLNATAKTTPLALSAPQFRMVGIGMLLLGPLVITVLGR
jgi:hypothetical protein